MSCAMHHLVFPINALPACQLVKEGIDEICWNEDKKFEAVSRYYEQVDADVLFFFSDVAIQAEALGAKARYSPEAMPSIKETAKIVSPPKAIDVRRMAVNAMVIKRLKSVFPDKIISTLVYGPFTVAGQVVGEQQVFRGIVERPKEVRDLLEKSLALAQDYGRYQLDAGANLLWVSDPLSALIPPDKFWAFGGEFLARLFQIFPTGPSVLHICGDTTDILDQMIKTGVGGISLDECMSLLAVEDLFPEDVCIMGNLDLVEIVELASSDEVAASVEDLVSVMGIKDNYSLSTGCALPPSTPINNVIRFIDTGKAGLSRLKPHSQKLKELGNSVCQGDRNVVPEMTKKTVEEGVSPLVILNSALQRAVRKGSARYASKQCYLPEILLMVDAFYQGFKMLEPYLSVAADRPPQLILGTVKGDFHEIGKDLVKIIMEANGIKVLDLGVNVSGELFLEASKSHSNAVVGLSALITSARKELAKIVEEFRQSGLTEIPILIGGAAANQQIATTIGAQGYARDAIDAVKLVTRALKRTEGQ